MQTSILSADSNHTASQKITTLSYKHFCVANYNLLYK
jgi:hypothetical protein